MWNLGQFRENLILCQLNCLIKVRIQKSLCTYVTHYCDYLPHTTFPFHFIDFHLNRAYRLPFPNFRFYRKITYSVTQRSVSQENNFKRSNNPSPFLRKPTGSNNSFTLIENNFRFLRKRSLKIQGNSTLWRIGKCTQLWSLKACIIPRGFIRLEKKPG